MTEDEARLILYELGSKQLKLEFDSARQTFWATPAQVAEIFGCSADNVTLHLKKMYASGELDKDATSEYSSEVRSEGGREVTRQVRRINLDAMIEVGYKVNSPNAIQFRQWSTRVIRELVLEGVVVDEERLAANPVAQKRLGQILRSLRLSEREMYQKVRDVFKASASDYDPNSPAARSFFAMAQDKFHFAATGKTAAQIKLSRADASKDNIGLTVKKGEHPTLADVTVAKNYLTDSELRVLENISEQFMLFAESKAMRGHKMTMEELSFRLNTLLTANDYPVLYEYESFQAGQAEEHVKRQLHSYQRRLRAANRTPLDQGGAG